MNRRSTAALALVGLVLLAGCSFASGLPPFRNPRPGELPPGIAANGTTNASSVADAHDAALNRTGYASRTEWEWSVRGTDDAEATHRHTTVVRRVEGGRTRALVRTRTSGGGQNRTTTVWLNETAAFTRVSTPNGTYRNARPVNSPGANRSTLLSDRNLLSDLLAAGNWKVERVHRPLLKPTRLELRHEGDERVNTRWLTVENASAVVDSRGVVHELTADVFAEYGDGVQRLHVHYELTEPRVRSVERPAWTSNLSNGRADPGDSPGTEANDPETPKSSHPEARQPSPSTRVTPSNASTPTAQSPTTAPNASLRA